MELSKYIIIGDKVSYRIMFFLLGFGLMVIGFTYIVTYLNLLTMGFSFINYIKFIFTRIECLFGIIGFIIVTITIFTKDGDNFDICI